MLVAVDGPDGAGKTTLRRRPGRGASVADGGRGRHSTTSTTRGPHRHAEGRTGETVWARGFDYEAVRRELLDPWRRGAGSSYRRRWHDLATDAYVDEPPDGVPEQGVLVVDGVFAQRPELDDALGPRGVRRRPDDVRMTRMAERDGVPADAEHPDQRRYLDAQLIYLTRCRPVARADVVIDNTDPAAPRIDANHPTEGHPRAE